MHHLGVRRRGGRDVHEVEVLVREELGGIRVGAAAEVPCRGGEPLGVGIADGDELHVRDLRPRVKVILREEAGADDSKPVRHALRAFRQAGPGAHSSTSLLGSLIHSLHEPTYIFDPVSPATVMARTFCAAVIPEPQ